jgi:hypothetical protein
VKASTVIARPTIELREIGEGYFVSRCGRVFSTRRKRTGATWRELETSPNSGGYPSVRITLAGVRHRYSVYGLVARAYLPPRPSPKHVVRHLDCDRNNSNASNLAWGTALENSADSRHHGRLARGEALGARQRRRFFTFGGETLHLGGWAARLGIKRSTLKERLRSGWGIERAFTEALHA